MSSITVPEAGQAGRRAWLSGVLTMALIGLLYWSGALAPLHHLMLDLRYAVLERPVSDTLTVVEIDPKSLGQLSRWPWPREFHAEVIERLLAAGAKRVAFDVDFSSESGADSDAALEQALRAGGGRVMLPVFQQYQATPEGVELILSAPLPRFQPLVDLASVNVVPDDDGVVRRLDATTRIDEQVLPAFAAAMAGRVPDAEAPFLIDFGIRVGDIPTISYVDVLRGTFDPAQVRDRTVVIGATAIELNDLVPVPGYGSIPGVFLHALAYETIVQGRELYAGSGLVGPGLAAFVILVLALPFTRLAWRPALALGGAALIGLAAASLAAHAYMARDVDASGGIAGVIALFLITVLRRVDLQRMVLRRQNEQIVRMDALMERIVETSFDAIVTFDDDGRIETANAAAGRMFGGAVEVGHIQDILPALRDGGQSLADRLRTGRGHIEFVARRRGSGEFPVEVSTTEMPVDGATLNVSVIRDITSRKRYEAELEHKALYDELTGLANRALLQDRLEKAIATARREGKPLALLLLDLDRFKEINDTLGHHVGDELLVEVSKRLSNAVRKSDTVARFGGDEFLALLPAVTDVERAERVAERMVRALQTPFEIDTMNLEVGASVGIGLFPSHAEDAEELMKCADVAMYMAKRGIGPTALYDREKDEHSVRNLALSGELRHAIENDQLFFAYQPKVDLATGEVFSFEALVRWIHPEHGFVPPDDFIGHAERTGLIGPLTRWGLSTALRQLAEWRGAGFDFAVAVNLSTANLMEPDLPDLVREELTRWRVPHDRVTLEITENALMSDPDQALRTVTKLSEIGVRLSIDDFGTGYSSLGYIKQLPVQELKIDKSFVMSMTEDTSDQVIVRSTIDLAHNLGLKVVAEGVESGEHMALLRSIGCDTVQGYHVSKPLPPDQLLEWLEGGTWPARRRQVEQSGGRAPAAA